MNIRTLGAIAALSVATASTAFSADPVAVKDWAFRDVGNGSSIAWTKSESGSTLGVYCASKGNCSVFIGVDIGCDEGSSKYSVMVNSDSGAMPVDGSCANISSPTEKPNYVLTLANFRGILSDLLKDHAIGFAVPLASGMFKVVHFSLEGSNEALAAMSQAMNSSDQKVGGKDQVL